MGTGALSDLPRWARDLLEGGRVARLGFVDDADHPRVLPVTYALAEDALWSAVDDKPKTAPDALEALRAKYEPYRESAPPGPLIRLLPRRALWWSARPS